MQPAFSFDGECITEITAREHTPEIRYQGRVCRYETDGRVADLGYTAQNRNGYYRAFAAVGECALHIKIIIIKACQ